MSDGVRADGAASVGGAGGNGPYGTATRGGAFDTGTVFLLAK
jgi:hypothetical protein